LSAYLFGPTKIKSPASSFFEIEHENDKSYTMRLASAIEYHRELGNWAVARLIGKESHADRRISFPARCFDVTIEHQNAIVVLCANRYFGSAFALVRILFEACVRGVWLRRCATDQELSEYNSDTLDKKFYLILEQVEEVDGFGCSVLGKVKEKHWKAMNSYTHTGSRQLNRRLAGDSLGPNYQDNEILEVLGFASTMCLFAAQQIALLSGDLSLANEMTEKTGELADLKLVD